MALIPVFHTLASNFPVDPAYAGSDIIEGMFVQLDSNGYIAIAGTAATACVGVAGDNISSTGNNTAGNASTSANTPFGAKVIVGSGGASRFTQNRVSDFFNETTGSKKMTVYTGVGEFWTDQYASGQTWTPGKTVYTDSAGKLTATLGGSARKVGIVLEGPTAYPSGVPGIDTQGSITLGTYVHFFLNMQS